MFKIGDKVKCIDKLLPHLYGKSFTVSDTNTDKKYEYVFLEERIGAYYASSFELDINHVYILVEIDVFNYTWTKYFNSLNEVEDEIHKIKNKDLKGGPTGIKVFKAELLQDHIVERKEKVTYINEWVQK